jgi:putative spermidine/putrescine transport system permease protein
MRRLVRITGAVYAALFVGFLILPALIIIPASLSAGDLLEFPPREFSTRWYALVAERETWLSSARVSLVISGLAGLVASLVGLAAGFAQYRYGQFRAPLRAALIVPILVPHIIVGSGMFGFMLLAGIGFQQIWPLVFVYSAVAVPIVLSVMVPTFASIDPLLWTAASTLGASTRQIFTMVIGPLLVPTLIVGFLLAFHTAWDETTFAIFIGPSVVPVLSTRMFAYLQQNVTPEIATVASLLLAATLMGAGLVYILSRQRRAADRGR